MALMKIAEPGQSPLPHQAKRAVGIDLGTTNSLVATVRGGRTEVLANADGEVMLPSVVHYAAGKDPVVGRAAQSLARLGYLVGDIAQRTGPRRAGLRAVEPVEPACRAEGALCHPAA